MKRSTNQSFEEYKVARKAANKATRKRLYGKIFQDGLQYANDEKTRMYCYQYVKVASDHTDAKPYNKDKPNGPGVLTRGRDIRYNDFHIPYLERQKGVYPGTLRNALKRASVYDKRRYEREQINTQISEIG